MADQEFKYLRIKNWKKYQPDAKLRNKDARLTWVKDYTDREDDSDFRSLTFFQRGVLEGLCRLVGRTPSRLIYYDPTYIAQALYAHPTDRSHIGHAIATLIARHFLVLCNQQIFPEVEQKGGGEREGEGEGEGFVSQLVSLLAYEPSAPENDPTDQTPSSGSQKPKEEARSKPEDQRVKDAIAWMDQQHRGTSTGHSTVMSELTSYLWSDLPIPLGLTDLSDEHLPAFKTIAEWLVDYWETSLDCDLREASQHTSDMLTWGLAHPFWSTRIHTLDNFASALSNDTEPGLPAQYARYLKKKRRKSAEGVV